ncbi:MAG: prolipoprotein diacylglyceryl transferase family protein, partial [Anaerolineales bacterium]
KMNLWGGAPPYTRKIAGGAAIALFWLWASAPRRGIPRRAVLIGVWAITLAALIGGRAGYLLENQAYFRQHPGAAFDLHRTGGMHGHGAWIGGLIALAIWCRVTARGWHLGSDLFAAPALLVAASAWWACAQAKCAWGRALWQAPPLVRWLIVELPDPYHAIEPRFAVQYIGAAWAASLALAGLVMRKRERWLLPIYFAGAAALSLLRADPAPIWPISPIGPTWRSDTLLSLLLALLLLGINLLTSASVHKPHTIEGL